MRYILISLFTLYGFISSSQSTEKQAIMTVVNNVFEAMRTSDSTLLKTSFVESPTTYTVFRNQEGKTEFRKGDFRKFIDAVGSKKDQIWNEPIWNEKVEIDDNLASVWVDYAFYLGDKFSHCGVDAFHLVRKEEGWKIFHLVDTRRREGCEIPDEFKP